jgi:hypothetical protein
VPTHLERTKFPVHWSGNQKNQLVLRTGNGPFLISIKWKLGWMYKLARNGSMRCFIHKWKNELDVAFYC